MVRQQLGSNTDWHFEISGLNGESDLENQTQPACMGPHNLHSDMHQKGQSINEPQLVFMKRFPQHNKHRSPSKNQTSPSI